jgi:4'-phosphopantetheinyl transferase
MNIYWLEQTEGDVPVEEDWLGPSEIYRLRQLRMAKRRTDWRLGRWTAKHAVAVYLHLRKDREILRSIEIRSDSAGAPEAFLRTKPASVSISLTHRAGVAACAVAPSGAGLGCDLEVIEEHGDAFVDDYFTDEEHRMIARAGHVDREKVVTIIWSAKESALKALRCGLKVDTRCLAISLCDGWPISDEGFHGCRPPWSLSEYVPGKWCPLLARYNSDQVDQVLHGWWRCSAKLTRSVMTLRPTEPPTLLMRESQSCSKPS